MFGNKPGREVDTKDTPIRLPERAPERSWQAPAERHGNGEAEAPRRAEPAPAADSSPHREPEPAHAEPVVESTPEEPARPARKGWWQRKFSGE